MKPEDKNGKEKIKVPVLEIQVPRKADGGDEPVEKPDSGRGNKNKVSQDKPLTESQSSAVSDSIKALSVSAVGGKKKTNYNQSIFNLLFK